MIRLGKLIAVAAVIALFAAPAAAQVPSRDARVSLRVEGRRLEEVVQFLRERSGANLVIVPSQEGGEDFAATPITLDLADVPWRQVLDLAAEAAGGIVEERSAGIFAVTQPKTVNFTFSNAQLTEVIDTIAKLADANIVVAPEVSGTLSLRLADVPWRDALDVAVKTLGFAVVEDQRGILRVVDPSTLQAQMETKHYQLRYLRPSGAFVPVINSEFVQGQYNLPTGNIEADFPIIEALRRALSEGGELNYVRENNTLIVRDTAQVHEQLKDMIARLDVEPAQVFIDVKFVSTANTDLFDLGVDYGDFGPRISASGGQIPITFPFDYGSGGFEDSLIANDTGSGPFNIGGNPEANGLGATLVPDTVFGALSFTGVSATLRMLQRDTKSEVVQAPKLVALDGRPATIFVGETIRYAEARTEQGQAGGLNLSVQEADGSPVEVGFQLMVRPEIIPGTNRMTLEVIPKETSLSGTGDSTLAPPGFDVFQVGAAGAAGSIALPRVRSSTIVTSMMLESGQTAVIGGLSTDTELRTESRVPFISAVPLLGELFKHRENTVERRSLMVFITPSILRSAGDSDRILQAELERRAGEYGEKLEEILYGPETEGTDLEAAPTSGGEDVELTTFVGGGS